MSEILIYAEKEDSSASPYLSEKYPERAKYDKYIEPGAGETAVEIERYGGHYDMVRRFRHPDGTITRSERFPAATQDYVLHMYVELPDEPGGES